MSRLAVIAILWAVPSTSTAWSEERPSPLAPYRYLSPADAPRNTVDQQEAFSYRNELAAERSRLNRGISAPADAASRLRSLSEVNRELRRVDRLLNR